MRILGTDIQNF